MAQDVVLLRFVADLGGIEGDVLEHVAQLGEVAFLDGVQRLVDPFAIAGLVLNFLCFAPYCLLLILMAFSAIPLRPVVLYS